MFPLTLLPTRNFVKPISLLLFLGLLVILPPAQVQAQPAGYQCPENGQVYNDTTGECRSVFGGDPVKPIPIQTTPPQTTPPQTTPPPTTSPNQPSSSGIQNGPAVIGCDITYNTTVNGLCIPKNPISSDPNSIVNSGNITVLLAKIVNILLYFAGIIAVIFVIIGGYRYMTAGGNEETAGKGRKTMVNAIIGLVIIILSYVIINAVTNFLIK